MTLIPEIDESSCIAHGDCRDISPGVFAVEATAVVIGSGDDEQVLAAARACPVGAITVRDRASGTQVYP